jgi:hypothetical protein
MRRRRTIADEDARRQVARAWEDVGATVSDRLEWVVDFINRDVARRTAAERASDGYALRVLASSFPLPDDRDRFVPSPSEIAIDARKEPLPDRLILSLHRELRAGIRSLLAPPPALPRTVSIAQLRALQQERGWQLPMQRRALLRLSIQPGGPRDYMFTTAGAPADERGGIIEAVVWLIEHSGNQLRACPNCGKPFVGIKRQEYCSPMCSQVIRNHRKQNGGTTR